MDNSRVQRRRRFQEVPSRGEQDSSPTVDGELHVSSMSLGGDSFDSSFVRPAASGDADLHPTGDAESGIRTAPPPLHSKDDGDASVKKAPLHLHGCTRQTRPPPSRLKNPPPPLHTKDDGDAGFKKAPVHLHPTDGAAAVKNPPPPLHSKDDGDAGFKKAHVHLHPTDAAAAVKKAPPPLHPTDDAAAADAPAPLHLVGDLSVTQIGASGRRNRWDQDPCRNCPSIAERVMTCCGACLCTGCVAVNPCGCPRWQEGFGEPVPVLPRYVVPADHRVSFPVLLPRHRWQLFHTHRTLAGNISYSFYNVEEAFHRRETGVLYQTHLYEGIVDRVWTRFRCRLTVVQGGGVLDRRGGVLDEFAVPPIDEHDIEVLYRWLEQYRRQQQRQQH